MKIQILGANCSKCNKVVKRFTRVIDQFNLNVTIEKITDLSEISKFNIYTLPTVIINDSIVFKGNVPSEYQIIQELNKYLGEDEKIISNIQKSKKKKPIWNYALLIILMVIISFLFFIQNNDETVCSISIDKPDTELLINIKDSIQANYNYILLNSPEEITFLEFGSTNCRACKMMEFVMDSIRLKFKDNVKVEFYNVTIDNGKLYADYFNIDVIPTQVLLDKSGKEIFRHIGYLSSEEITKELRSYGIKN